MGHFGPVLDSLLNVANLAEQLTFESLSDQDIPRSGEACAHSEALGGRVDVIELEIPFGPAANAAAAEHLHKLITTTVPPGLVVAPEVLGTCLASLGHCQEPLPGFRILQGK